ncbi:MAG: methyl-accepting chemotaxis protein [Actinomycetota bacterium]|nr:methyl-accepting chemotaxis protein [Actinomycetota bacterium]
MRVRTKILAVAAAAIAGTVAVSALSLTGLADLRATRADEVGGAVPYVTALSDTALAAKAAANDARGYLLTGDDEFTDGVDERLVTIGAALDDAVVNAAGPAQVETVEEIRVTIEDWFDTLDQQFAVYTTDPDAALAVSVGTSRPIRKQYEALLGDELDRAETALVEGRDFQTTYDRVRLLMLLLAAAAVAAAIGGAFSVGRMITGPLARVGSVLRSVADGDLTRDSGVHQGDEVGRMAASLRDATRNLQETISSLADHARNLAGSAEELTATAESSVRSADDGAARTASVAEAAGSMSTTVQSLAASAEEMGTSIREISTSATTAANVAGRAVEAATSAGAAIDKLGASSAEIGNVVAAITSIAEQTNLLALNATIEAARAGDAGRGFAVVASEVKDLAQETARATDDISRRVGAIQEDTSIAVAAIGEIRQVIAEVSKHQTAIAGAVEEQNVTTSGMTRSINDAAGAGDLVATNIDEVSQAVQVATIGINDVNLASTGLASMAADLQRTVERFRY